MGCTGPSRSCGRRSQQRVGFKVRAGDLEKTHWLTSDRGADPQEAQEEVPEAAQVGQYLDRGRPTRHLRR